MSDNPYAAFGVNNAVISSSDPEEHTQNMLALDVRARDGDTSIDLVDPADDDEQLGEDAEEADESTDEESDAESSDETETSDEEFAPLDEPSDELKAASEAITKYADGFSHMREQAIKAGLPESVADAIEADYEATQKISDANYAALAKAGYSREFVDSYIQGQEAVAEQFVAKVVDYAGGQSKFQALLTHMQSNSPEAVDSLYEAFERQDLKAIRTILNLGAQSQTKKFGKTPKNNVLKSTPAVAPQRKAAKAEGYTSTADMIKDMSSHAYRQDPAFRAKVEARVAASRF